MILLGSPAWACQSGAWACKPAGGGVGRSAEVGRTSLQCCLGLAGQQASQVAGLPESVFAVRMTFHNIEEPSIVTMLAMILPCADDMISLVTKTSLWKRCTRSPKPRTPRPNRHLKPTLSGPSYPRYYPALSPAWTLLTASP